MGSFNTSLGGATRSGDMFGSQGKSTAAKIEKNCNGSTDKTNALNKKNGICQYQEPKGYTVTLRCRKAVIRAWSISF